MKKFRIAWVALMVVALFAAGKPVRADSAPPMNPPGGDVSPEGGTEVQMVAEQVVIDFRQYTDDRAKVTAWFQFRNTGASDEFMNVRFPLNGDEMWTIDPATGESSEYYPLIQDFTASIGGAALPTQVVKDTDPNAAEFFLGTYGDMFWSTFPVTFPAGQDVRLNVSYTFQPTEAENYAEIFYVLATGAGWKGPIGTADVIIRFPYELNDLNLFNYDADRGMIIPYYGEPMAVVENEVRLHWDDLEPADHDNVRLLVLQPKIWQEILRRRIQVMNYPTDAGGWEALASAYAAAGAEKHGMFSNPKLATMYISACEKALTLDPNNINLHFEFAKNMLWASMFDQTHYYLAIAENELATVLKLDPTNVPALDFLNENKDYFALTLSTPGPFPTQFIPTYTPWSPEPPATSTPRSTGTATFTRIPGSTGTILPVDTATLYPSPSPAAPSAPAAMPPPRTPWLIILGGLALAIAGFAGGARFGRRKN